MFVYTLQLNPFNRILSIGSSFPVPGEGCIRSRSFPRREQGPLSTPASERQRSLGRIVVRRPNSFRIAEDVNGGSRAVRSNSLLVTNAEPVDRITTGKIKNMTKQCVISQIIKAELAPI